MTLLNRLGWAWVIDALKGRRVVAKGQGRAVTDKDGRLRIRYADDRHGRVETYPQMEEESR